MKLSDVTPSRNRLFTGATLDGVTVSFLGKLMGKDGHDEPMDLWLGKLKMGTDKAIDAAISVHPSGIMVAVNTDAPEAAIKQSLGVRKGYGKSLRPDYNWRVVGFNGTVLQGYTE